MFVDSEQASVGKYSIPHSCHLIRRAREELITM